MAGGLHLSSPRPPPPRPSLPLTCPHLSTLAVMPATRGAMQVLASHTCLPGMLRALRPPRHNSHLHNSAHSPGPGWCPQAWGWGGARAGRGLGRLMCLSLHRLSQAAPLPEAAGSQREHGAGGGGHLPRGLHPVHRARRRHHGLSAPPPLSGQSHKPAPRSRQVFFSR